jgi:hypothetical protein
VTDTGMDDYNSMLLSSAPRTLSGASPIVFCVYSAAIVSASIAVTLFPAPVGSLVEIESLRSNSVRILSGEIVHDLPSAYRDIIRSRVVLANVTSSVLF